MVATVLTVTPVSQDPTELMVLMVLRENLVNKELKDLRVTRESKVVSVSPGSLEVKVFKVRPVLMEPLVKQVNQELTEHRVRMVSSERRVSLVKMVLLESRENLEVTVLTVLMGLPVPMEPKVHREKLGMLENKVHRDLMENLAKMV